MKHTEIQKTNSIQKLAAFWDTHDLTDFENELEEVPERLFADETVIEIHLPPVEAETVRQLAHSQGIRTLD